MSKLIKCAFCSKPFDSDNFKICGGNCEWDRLSYKQQLKLIRKQKKAFKQDIWTNKTNDYVDNKVKRSRRVDINRIKGKFE